MTKKTTVMDRLPSCCAVQPFNLISARCASSNDVVVTYATGMQTEGPTPARPFPQTINICVAQRGDNHRCIMAKSRRPLCFHVARQALFTCQLPCLFGSASTCVLQCEAQNTKGRSGGGRPPGGGGMGGCRWMRAGVEEEVKRINWWRC